ncbi:histone acetyltransferase KAT6A-like [Montipora foliosa]|uniref:histone acetyltransferase KAT6A-like n=1 Tax=Montipora foliosa TaxID=591990 RepID=UPI0035F19255
MTEKRPKYMNWILECINLLRSRKSRPDLERICRTMHKCHGIDQRDTEEDLSVLIASGIVTKRSFKGAISYRNASGWHRVLGSSKVSRAARWVGEAIRALDRGYGVSAVDIEKFISARHPYYHNLKARIKIALKEDLDNGRIWSVSDGMYRLLESAESPEREIPECEQVCDFCLQTAAANRRGEPENLLICRDCGNKAHPSCMNYSPELVHRITSDASAWQCIDCKACIICNDSGDPGSLLFCDACDKGYHMQCHVPPLATMPIGKWVCYNCQNHPISPVRLADASEFVSQDTVMKTEGASNMMLGDDLRLQCDEDMGECTVEVKDIHIQVDAENVQRELEMLSQESVPSDNKTNVARAVHSDMACHSESNGISPSASAAKIAVNGMPGSPGKESPIACRDSSKDTERGKSNLPPETSLWTVTEVVSFFSSLGFPEEAKSFQNQEIDGKALLLMSRNDVLTGMSIKLGPALKIYVHIARLQSQNGTIPS